MPGFPALCLDKTNRFRFSEKSCTSPRWAWRSPRFTGWIFYSRWNDNQAAVRARQEREAQSARQTLELLGGDELKILTFYPLRNTVRRGGTSTVCFGVSGAKSVRIEPEIEAIKPVISRCVQASPRKTTTYTLIAQGRRGAYGGAELCLNRRALGPATGAVPACPTRRRSRPASSTAWPGPGPSAGNIPA